VTAAARSIPERGTTEAPRERALNRPRRVAAGKFVLNISAQSVHQDTTVAIAYCNISATPEATFRVPVVQ
jgi:hypothetical protein